MIADTDTATTTNTGAMFDKIWDRHVIIARAAGPSLIYIDRDIIHEGSFHAFADMKRRGLTVRNPRQLSARRTITSPHRAAASQIPRRLKLPA